MNRLSFHVPVSRTDLHRVPCVPEDGNAARGICVGLVLAVPVWCALAALAMWARGWRL